MSSKRFLHHLPVALFVTLGLLTRHGGGVAKAESVPGAADQPRMVGVSPLATIDRRQVFQVLVNQRTGEAKAFGYFMYIHGLDEDALYLDNSRKHETKAFFTLYIQGRLTRMHQNGRVLVFQLQSKSVISFNPTPDGDFSDPESFKHGIPIATGDENGSFTFDPESGEGSGDVRLRQTSIGDGPFQFNGELIQFGEVGNHDVAWRGKVLRYNPFGWTRLFCSATTIQAAPAPPSDGL
jgi:hypothetical protein